MKKNTQLLSSMNRSAILTLLRAKGPVSRADISRELGLSFPAVSSNVKCLIEANLIYEVGEGNNALGRKSTLLAYNANKAFLVGVDIGRRNIRTMCANMLGEIKAYHKVKISGEDIYHIITGAIAEVVAQASISIDDVTSIGVGIPGIYNEKTGYHCVAPFVDHWSGVELFQKLKQSYSKQSMFFENSVNLGAIGERWKGRAKDYKNIVYMEFGVGFGAAILLDGQIMHGANGAAGEIGYMALESELMRSEFANEGSFEQLIPSKLISRYIEELDQNRQEDMEYILSELKTSIAPKYVDRIPRYFAMSIINTISVINPEIVIISGKLGCALYQCYEKTIQQMIEAHIPFPPVCAISALNERANVLGAIFLAMQNMISDYQTI